MQKQTNFEVVETTRMDIFYIVLCVLCTGFVALFVPSICKIKNYFFKNVDDHLE